MTIGDREQSRNDAKPILSYAFSQGATAYRWTSAEEEIVLPSFGTFQPIYIAAGDRQYSDEDTGEVLELTVRRDNPIALLFADGAMPSSRILVKEYSSHRGDEALAYPSFDGEVVRARGRGSESILECHSAVKRLDREFPTLRIQSICNNVLYQSPGCAANPTISQDLVTVSSVDGTTVVSASFALRADGWYSNGGRLRSLDLSEQRTIVSHVGDTIELLSRMPGLESGDQVFAIWGCNRLRSDCGPAKHNVLDSHQGWDEIPTRNPFSQGVE